MWINHLRNLSKFGIVLVSSLFASAATVVAQDQATNEPAAPDPVKAARPSRDELKDKQLDVSLETRDIERVLGKLKKASELAKQRITEAAVTTESVSTSLNKGDSKSARVDAKQASEKFKEIVKQLEALLKEETPQQIAEAKQLAKELAKLEREFADKFEGALNPLQVNSSGETKIDPKSQVAPMTNDELKGKGSTAKTESKQNEQGKSDTVPEDSKPKSPDPQRGDKKADPKTGDPPKPESGDGDTPNGKKPADSGTSDDTKDADTKKPDGTGEKPDSRKQGDGDSQQQDQAKPDDETKPGGGGASKAKPDKPGAGMSPEQLREAVARRAEKLAETGKTLQDVLNTIARSDNPADKDAAARIQAVLNEFNMNKLIEQMEGVGGMIRSRKDADVKMSSVDLAERFEIMAQRLDAAYRGIVAPQAEELRKLEALLIEMREKLDELETPTQVAGWHREMRDLLDQLDKLGLSLEARNLLEKEMQKGGFGLDRDPTRRTLDWGLINDRYVAPLGYQGPLALIQEEVQTRIQSLILGDFGNLSDDSTPPMYQELVDRFYQVLSGEQGHQVESREAPSNRKRKDK